MKIKGCKEIQRDAKRTDILLTCNFNSSQVAASNSERATGSASTRMGSAPASTIGVTSFTMQQPSIATGGFVSCVCKYWPTDAMVKSEGETKGLRILTPYA